MRLSRARLEHLAQNEPNQGTRPPIQWRRTFRRIVLAFFICLFLFGGGLSFIHIFRIRNIIVEGAENVSGTEIADGSLIFFADRDKMQEFLFEKNPTFSRVQVEKIYPDTIKVSVQASKSIAYIEAEGGFLMLGETGRVLLKPKVGMVPRTGTRIQSYQRFYYDQTPIGALIQQPEIQYVLPLLVEFARLGLPCESVVIENFHMVVCNSDTKRIVFSTEKPGEEVYLDLKEVVRKLHISGQDFTDLDLRFDKPVLRLANTKQY